jgi:transcriptional regulator with XRE-family HTH domain
MNALKRYLTVQKITLAEFAGRLCDRAGHPDAVSTKAVQNWANGVRTPNAEAMRLIYDETAGAVDANSFYGIDGGSVGSQDTEVSAA